MSDLRELYQEVILDHNRQPRNFRSIGDASHTAEGFNPICGDKVTIFLVIEDGVVKDVSFQGVGCAISTAAASLLTESVKGKSVEAAEALFERMHRLLTAEADADADELGKLMVFSGVREYPMRVKCATLSWHTFRAALAGQREMISTE